MFEVRPDGEVANDESSIGYKAVGVPGTFAGLSLALERYGTMSLRDTARDAIGLAKAGFDVGRFLAFIMEQNLDSAYDKFTANLAARRLMLKPDGKTYAAGEKLVLQDLGSAIERVAVHGLGEFSGRQLGEALTRDMGGNGGLLTERDLSDYRPRLLKPLVAEYGEFQIVTMPPPSSGGVALVQMLKILEDQRLSSKGLNTPATIDLMARALGSVWPRGAEGGRSRLRGRSRRGAGLGRVHHYPERADLHKPFFRRDRPPGQVQDHHI